jgi:adenine-specific DNA-methyltransferase
MKGFVPTPAAAVDLMVEKLFRERCPTAEDRVLDPGSGQGAFVDGLIRYCSRRQLPTPTIVAVESDPAHVDFLTNRFAGMKCVVVREADFLTMPIEQFDYVIGNPPYVSITGLTDGEKTLYRNSFLTASGRFDLYILFFERALQSLRHNGRLVFITPEKYLYVNTAAPLRHLLSSVTVSELHYFPEDTFADRVTYPLVTVVDAVSTRSRCTVTERDGTVEVISGDLPSSSWLPVVRRAPGPSGVPRLSDIALRVSCGVATGADAVFVLKNEDVPEELQSFA